MIRLFYNFRIVTFLFCEGRHGVMVTAIGVSAQQSKSFTSNNSLFILSKKAQSYPGCNMAKWRPNNIYHKIALVSCFYFM